MRTRAVEQLLGRGAEQVAVDDRQVGAETGLEDAEAILGEPGVGGAGGVGAEGLLEAESMLGVPASGRACPRSPAG